MAQNTQTSPQGAQTSSILDLDALSRWMDREGLPGNGELAQARTLSGGSQNELFEIVRGGEKMALRRPPSYAVEGRAKVLMREARLLKALAGTDVPHATFRGASDDESVIGTPFYLMDLVDGWSPMGGGWAAPFDTDLEARGKLGLELVDGAARMARVDWKARGLEGFGKPEGFLDRQVDRWLSHLSGFKFRDIPGLEETAAWLRKNRPTSFQPGIMHGDYQFANVMFRHGKPAKLAAIIDWEMTTIGDPLLDLGWVLVSWPPEGDAMKYARYLNYDGMPSRDTMLEHYATVSGLDVSDVDYYVILARFKLAIVLEASVARHAKGEADERVARFGPIVLELMEFAASRSRQITLR
ncbi:phosphotransferase family protein [Rhodococcus oxybenzonivorans]|uniref:phosphotransferase family protein n=1 Tax=Rhodococcus oxybenzonivorans TaxID=1990687 RepID=UPI0029532E91|nr:phosphotransferase family protein [Rhodococcus oxybenzonivorans]MDV7352759.1 phosphotransferase family protein [Rhodococcus oxybenzonivorans]